MEKQSLEHHNFLEFSKFSNKWNCLITNYHQTWLDYLYPLSLGMNPIQHSPCQTNISVTL